MKQHYRWHYSKLTVNIAVGFFTQAELKEMKNYLGCSTAQNVLFSLH